MWSHQFGCNFYRATMSRYRFSFILLSCSRFDDKNTRAQRRAEHRLAPIKDSFAFIELHD